MRQLYNYLDCLKAWLDTLSAPQDGADFMPGLPPGKPLKMRQIRKMQKLTLADLGVDKLHCHGCDTWHYPDRSCLCDRLNKKLTQS